MKLLGLLSGLLGYATLASRAAHLSFSSGQNVFSAYDDGLFTPLGDPSVLSATEFTTLSHPAFSRHKVRVKQSHFCDGSVRYASFHRLARNTALSDVAYLHPELTQGTSTSRRGTCSSTSSSLAVTPTRTTSSSGPTAAREHPRPWGCLWN